MARIVNIVLGVVATAAVAVLAVVVAREADLLAGSLVVLAALMGLVLLNRARASRQERSARADWDHILDGDAPAEAFFSDWTETTPRARPATDDRSADAAPAGPTGEPAVPTSGATSAPTPPPSRPGFPFDDDDGFGDLPPLGAPPTAPTPLDLTGPSPVTPAPVPAPAPAAGPPAPPEPAAAPPADDDVVPAPDGHRAPIEPPHVPVVPAAATDEAVVLPEAAPLREESYSMAGAAPSGNGTSRRALIDWTGPTRIVEDEVRTSDDILAASAATALPTAADDRPAPAAGSELARLLAKVEERLRDYD